MRRYLLTSQMIHNQSIASSLAKLLGKPFSESRVAYIATSYNGANINLLDDKTWLVDNINSVHRLGWNKFYILDIAAMNGLDSSTWMPMIDDADVIVMGGGANFFLSYWLNESGLMQKLAKMLKDKVYVGASAGSMLLMPLLATSSNALDEFKKGNWDIKLNQLGPESRRSDKTLNLVDFLIRPHYSSSSKYNDELLQKVSSKFNLPLYALDDDSAIEVNGSDVSVISEGEWKLFKP